MWNALIHQSKGFAVGVFVTILVVGCAHIRLDFRFDPDQQELAQTEKLDKQASAELNKFKPVKQVVSK